MEINELKDRLQTIIGRIPENEKETEQAMGRMRKAEIQLVHSEEKFEVLRKDRQKTLAEGRDPKKVNSEIKNLKDQKEMLEDETIGLKDLLALLNKEREELLREKVATERLILKEETIRPLVDKYNMIAREMGALLDDLERAIFQYSLMSHQGIEEKPPVYPSNAALLRSWDETALASIPALSMEGEPLHEHIYHRKSLVEELKTQYMKERVERNKTAQENAKKRQEEEQAFLEGKYSDAVCFGCRHYSGVQLVADGVFVLACESFTQGIPEAVLSGTTRHVFRLESERFLFEPLNK